QVILRDKVLYVDRFGLKFPGWVRPEHIKTFLRNCFIPNSTKKAVDPSLSTASTPSSEGGFCPELIDLPLRTASAELHHVRSLWSTRIFHDIEFHDLTFAKGLKSLFLNGGIVDKDVFAAFPFDETVSFVRVEPLHSALHVKHSLLKMIHMGNPMRINYITGKVKSQDWKHCHEKPVKAPCSGTSGFALPSAG